MSNFLGAYHRRSFGRNIQREMPGVPYIRAGAYAPLHDFTASRKIALKRRGASLIYGRLRGTFPLGLPECIRQTALPSVRGPDRASRLRRVGCWSATSHLKSLQQPFFILERNCYPAVTQSHLHHSAAQKCEQRSCFARVPTRECTPVLDRSGHPAARREICRNIVRQLYSTEVGIRSKARDLPQYCAAYLDFFAQESFSATVRLNTGLSALLSLSLQKYP